MKKVIKHVCLRATQTAIISGLLASLMSLAVESQFNHGDFAIPHWDWIIQAMVISTITAVFYVIFHRWEDIFPVKTKARFLSITGSWYDESDLQGSIIISVIIALGFVVTHNIEYTRLLDVDTYVFLGTMVCVAIASLFYSGAIIGLLFALFFGAIAGTFRSIHWSSGCERAWDFWLTLGTIVIACRLIRIIFIFLFVKKHELYEKAKD